MKNAAYWKGRTLRETFDRWWRTNPATGCHEWQRSLTAQGYGQLNIGGRPMLAHRYSWLKNRGLIASGLHVLHRCDNRKCVNPGHLFLGTNLENIQDKVQKGRSTGPGLSCERHPRAKLTWNSVAAIRAEYATGDISQRALAAKFGVSQGVIKCVVLRQTWNGDGTDPETRADFSPAKKAKRVTVLESFDQSYTIAQSGCWLWTRGKDTCGYGTLRVGPGRKMKAHRLSYERAKGPVPSGLVVRHKCDTPACVNPDHLFLGTQPQNIADMVSRRRQRGPVGERNSHAKLTRHHVAAIRKMAATARTGEIAARFGIDPAHVRRIVTGRSWAV